MRHSAKFIPAVAVSLLLGACGSGSTTSPGYSSASSGSTGSQTRHGAVVKTASNSTLGTTVLVDSHGLTLYHLSGEQNGTWICTGSACLKAWHPLTVASGAAPSGTVGSLATITRAGGTIQVTYKGAPLYTFVGDQKPGDAKGEGLKDVGIWTAVTASAPASSTPAPASASGSSPYSY